MALRPAVLDATPFCFIAELPAPPPSQSESKSARQVKGEGAGHRQIEAGRFAFFGQECYNGKTNGRVAQMARAHVSHT
jgi:hypothetical protein